MGWSPFHQFCIILVVFLALLPGNSAAASISDSVFSGDVVTGRSLLRAKKNKCPIKFEFQNYTIITSKCKAPWYPAELCCPAFKQFACPFAEYLNDLPNNCATSMFSYINLKFPPGLFFSECRDGEEGLECPAE